MANKYTQAIKKASQAVGKGAKKKVIFGDAEVIVGIDSRGVVRVSVFKDKRLFGELLKFCEESYGVTQSTPPGEWYGTIIC